MGEIREGGRGRTFDGRVGKDRLLALRGAHGCCRRRGGGPSDEVDRSGKAAKRLESGCREC